MEPLRIASIGLGRWERIRAAEAVAVLEATPILEVIVESAGTGPAVDLNRVRCWA